MSVFIVTSVPLIPTTKAEGIVCISESISPVSSSKDGMAIFGNKSVEWEHGYLDLIVVKVRVEKLFFYLFSILNYKTKQKAEPWQLLLR